MREYMGSGLCDTFLRSSLQSLWFTWNKWTISVWTRIPSEYQASFPSPTFTTQNCRVKSKIPYFHFIYLRFYTCLIHSGYWINSIVCGLLSVFRIHAAAPRVFVCTVQDGEHWLVKSMANTISWKVRGSSASYQRAYLHSMADLAGNNWLLCRSICFTAFIRKKALRQLPFVD